MGIAGFSFIIIFALIASGGMLLFYRQAMLQRISDVVTQRPKRSDIPGHDSADRFVDRRHGVEHLDRVVPKS